jgi:hypothetical protein
MTLGPVEVAVIVLGFAGLALGPSARSADRATPPEAEGVEGHRRASPLRIVLKTAFAFVLLDLIISRGLNIAGFVAASPTWRTGWVDDALAWFRSLFPLVLTRPWMFFQSPQWLALALAQAWVSWRVACLLVSPIETDPTPIDLCLENPRRAGRFAIRWVALTVLMVAALPVLFVAGLVAVHDFLRVFG